MPSFTLLERFRRIRRSWSKDVASFHSPTTENPDGAPPPYTPVNVSNPLISKSQNSSLQTSSPPKAPSSSTGRPFDSASRLSFRLPTRRPEPTPTLESNQVCTRKGDESCNAHKDLNLRIGLAVSKPFREPNESHMRLSTDLTLLMMEETSTMHWVQENPFRNADRFRHFLYHYLVWQYQVRDLHVMITKQDQRHFVLLSRLVCESDYYRECELKEGSHTDDLLSRVKKYIEINMEHVLSHMLRLDRIHIKHTMREWVEEFGKHYSSPQLSPYTGFLEIKLEVAARKGKWEEVGKRVANDLKMVDAVVPYGDDQARKSLVMAVRRRQQSYLDRAARLH